MAMSMLRNKILNNNRVYNTRKRFSTLSIAIHDSMEMLFEICHLCFINSYENYINTINKN